MALMMGAVMAVIMLLFMWKMYENKKINVIFIWRFPIRKTGCEMGPVATMIQFQLTQI